jgi:hypothetical protein
VSTPRSATAIVIFALASSFLWAEETCSDLRDQGDQTRYELRNVSGSRSPIQIVGYLIFRDDPATNVRVYCVYASARNVSTKKISYWSVGFETTGGSGPGLNLIQSNDYFFTGDVFAPGQTAKVPSSPISLVIRTGNNDSPAETGAPDAATASARIKFVQFIDGSTWGEREYAVHVHQLRRATLDKFESLQHLYSEGGEKAFVDALEEPTGLPFFEQIKSDCQSQNADSVCARQAIQRMLTIAAQQKNLEID